jgi:aminoglycoside 3-N-acetyltransferase
MRQAMLRKARTYVGKEDVASALLTLKIPPDKDVLVHSSASSLGRIEGGAFGLFTVLRDALITSHRTVLVPALPFNSTMRHYLQSCLGFDVRRDPNRMGVVAELFMSADGAMRSLHPTHSAAAIGHAAADFTATHHLDETPFGTNSPYWKLVERRGFILLVGVGLNAATNTHVVEDLLGHNYPVDIYEDKIYVVQCTDADGSRMNVRTRCHSERWSSKRDVERARPFLIRSGAMKTLILGESEVSLLDARGFARTLLQMLLQDTSIYGGVSLTADGHSAVRRHLELLA